MGLESLLKSFVYVEAGAALRESRSINLNYTLRLKNGHDEWVIQLEIEGVPHCHVGEQARLSPNAALRKLKQEASGLKKYLHDKFGDITITGSYYSRDRKKKRDFGELE